MTLFNRFKNRSRMKLATVLLAAGIVLAGCGSANDASPPTTSTTTPLAASSGTVGSTCTTNGGSVQQSLNGDFSGCFRVPELHNSSVVVALQAYLFSGTAPANASTTTVSPPATLGHIALSPGSKIVTPGESVTLTGRFLSRPPSAQQRQSYVTVCWDGCQTGLQEQGAPIHWSSSTMFQVSLTVPETAWLSTRGGAVSAHPLESGSYEVGVQCIEATSGCALGPADAQATIQLKTPTAAKCLTRQSCETMTLSTSNAAPGNVILFKGWAPLPTIIGQSTGYQLSLSRGSARKKYPALSFTHTLNARTYSVVLSPRVLQVSPSPTWADLGRVPYLSSTYAGPSAVQPSSTSNRIAWCPLSGIDITTGPALTPVPTGAVAAALRGTNLSLALPSSRNPPCSAVLVDPRYPASVYATFGTDANHSAPPIYFAGLYTTDNGISWRNVPTPPGSSLEDFGGFITNGNQVEALFASGSVNSSFPPGTNDGLVPIEVTANGGATWSAGTLGCPSIGPCTTFGPDQWGHCAMNASPQSVLQGHSATIAPSGMKWVTTFWTPTVNSCFSPQLTVNSLDDLMLLDPSSQYPLMRSTNSGQTWTSIQLPQISAANYGPGPIQLGNSLLLAPNGSLFTVATAASGGRQRLFRLDPGAAKWCQVPKFLNVNDSPGAVGPLRTSETNLIWIQTKILTGGESTSNLHVVPLSSLRC